MGLASLSFPTLVMVKSCLLCSCKAGPREVLSANSHTPPLTQEDAQTVRKACPDLAS